MVRYIWKPGGRGPMHYQAHTPAGQELNASLCGIVYRNYRTINPPFGLGKGRCKHCEAILRGDRAMAKNVRAAA